MEVDTCLYERMSAYVFIHVSTKAISKAKKLKTICIYCRHELIINEGRIKKKKSEISNIWIINGGWCLLIWMDVYVCTMTDLMKHNGVIYMGIWESTSQRSLNLLLNMKECSYNFSSKFWPWIFVSRILFCIFVFWELKTKIIDFARTDHYFN